MKVYKNLFLCFFIILLIPSESAAQRDVYNWQITPYAGLLTIDNDIDFPQNTNTYAYGLRVERRLGNDFTLGIHFANLDLGGAVKNNISGGFLSLGYYWDNGYLLSQRSFLSVFHRLEIGYADRYSTLKSISEKSSDFAVGFENGLKFRLGDRISADLALEIFSSKANLTSGDIIENIRYNVWKAGVTYHFGSRKSNFVAPVFVPNSGVRSHLDKIETQEESIWIVNDSMSKEKSKVESPDSVRMIPQLSLADSLLIFMHFDSLYQRKAVKDTLVSNGDSIAVDTVSIDSIPVQEYDSLKTSGSLVPLVDSTQYVLKTSDSLVSPIDSTRYAAYSAAIVSADSVKLDTTSVLKPASLDSSAIMSPVVSDTVVVLKTDTVYMEKPEPTDFDQKSDTSAQSKIIDNRQGSVDTLYIVKNAEEKLQQQQQPQSKSSGDAKQTVNRSNATQTTSDHDAKISSLQSEIDRLQKQNKKSNTGKVVAAGAAGAVLGSVLSKDRKSEKDTVYVVNKDETSRIDSLQNELDSLKQMYVISTTTLASSDSIVDLPIGMYFSEGDSASVLVPDSALVPDSTYVVEIDSLALKPDTLSSMNDAIVTEALDKSPADSLNMSDKTTVPIVVAELDTSAAEPKVSVEELKVEEPETVNQKDIAALMGEYPVKCNFGLNKTDLDQEELEKLDVVLYDLKNDESRKAMLTGYTDKSGNAEYNLQLSKKRANSVREYIISNGISTSRIEINAGGVLSSAEKYSPDARRVEVMVQENK